MEKINIIQSLSHPASTKIVLLVLDGLGGLPPEGSHQGTELEAAKTPELDRIALEGSLGQTIPVRTGITPGSGPAHLSLFGYDPVFFDVGRGILEASGIGIEVQKGDVAARGNLVTLDRQGKIVDRRAGRISSEEAAPIIDILNSIKLEGVEIETRVAREYRFSVVLRGEDLAPSISDTDPLSIASAPLPAAAEDKASERTASLVNDWIVEAHKKLADQPVANGLTLRGFSTNPLLPQFEDIYKLSAGCVAVYPMYRGVSKLVGMDIVEFGGEDPADEFQALSEHWDSYDFFFMHIKNVDSLGEDGNFEGKSEYIEYIDQLIPSLMELEPDVLAVTGDHSTPARMKSHSWHPVPLLLWAPATIRADDQSAFGEAACARGGLGTIHGTEVMPLLLAHADRLIKYGA